MSKLLEYEVKQVLLEAGIAVPEGLLVRADRAVPLEQPGLEQDADGAWFVKAQVAVGDRAAVGGVRRVDGLEAAQAAADAMLGTDVGGTIVDTVLVERGVLGGAFEGYAAVVVAEDPPRRVVVFSPVGGGGFDPSTAPVRLDVTDGPQGYRIRGALRGAGVASSDLVPIATFLERLVTCAQTWCTYTLETNPVTLVDGAVVALDAKADVDDYSRDLLPRPELLDRPDQDQRERSARERQGTDHRGSLRYVQLVPEDTPVPADCVPRVASHSVGGGESMVVLDAITAAGLVATNYCDTSGSPSAEKVAHGAGLVAGQKHVDGLLFSTCIANQRLSVTAEGLISGWDAVGWRGPTVVRFAGNESDVARGMVAVWAARNDVRVELLGEDHDEWQAALRLAEMLRNDREAAR